MEDGVEVDSPVDSLQSRVQRLQSSSTNAQTEAIRLILLDLEKQDESNALSQETLAFLPHLLATYPRQLDRRPRKLIHSCLRLYLRADRSGKLSTFLGNYLVKESQKPVAAASNAFVLLEWCTIIEDELAKQTTLNEILLKQVCVAQAHSLDKCLATDTRVGVSHTALVVARRGMRSLLKQSEQLAGQRLPLLLTELTKTSANPANAGLLGVISGVSERAYGLSHENIDAILDFYVKTLLGCKTALPRQQTHGLNEFFTRYVSAQQIEKIVVPALEKGILRSPDNILQGPIIALAESTSSDINFGTSVAAKLVKPLLSSLGSTNTTVRDGAGQSLAALLARKQDDAQLEAVLKELFANLKTSKAAAYELRALVCDAVSAIPPSRSISLSIVQSLLPIASKEANEGALRREIATVAVHTPILLIENVWTKEFNDAVLKGIAEKRPTFRKVWVTCIAVSLFHLNERPEDGPAKDFVNQILNATADSFLEIAAKPLPAAQAGTVSLGFVVPAFLQNPVLWPMLESLQTKLDISALGTQLVQVQSFLLNPQVYSKVTLAEDQKWALIALLSLDKSLLNASDESKAGWGRALLHFLLAPESHPNTRKLAGSEISGKYMVNPAAVGSSIVLGVWSYLRDEQIGQNRKIKSEDAPLPLPLRRAIATITPSKGSWRKLGLPIPEAILKQQAISTVVLYGEELIPGVDWVSNLLALGVDPGTLATDHTQALMKQVLDTFEQPRMSRLSIFEQAACRATATLTFVAPEAVVPVLVSQIQADLNSKLLVDLGATEAAIARAPEGVLVVDPLSKSNGVVENKNVKDYDTLKWEEELREQLAKKKGAAQKKLTPDQQAKVDAQVIHEKEIRIRTHQLSLQLRRGAGFVHALAVGPPTEARLWLSSAITALTAVLEAGASLFVDDELVAAYLSCSNYVTDRLGALRPFIGVAILRALGTAGLMPEFESEPLAELATRVLYRLRFASEQRPFDTPSLAYSLPLIFNIVDNGRIGHPESSEDADAQVLLALEFLSFQMSSCSDTELPRAAILQRLFSCMQKYPQHYRMIKDCVSDLASAIAANINDEERDVLLRSTTLADGSARAAALQAINDHLDLSDMPYSVHIWIACQDIDEENAVSALEIWEENEFEVTKDLISAVPEFLQDNASSTRLASATALSRALSSLPDEVGSMLAQLQTTYQHEAQPLVPKADKRGIIQRGEILDPWERRHGIALSFKELAPVLREQDLLPFLEFLVSDGPLSDRNSTVRDAMSQAGTAVVTLRGKQSLEPMMALFEKILSAPDKGTQESDWINEAVIVFYGSIARHLPTNDPRLKTVLGKLIATLSTPSESVQYAVTQCLPPLVRAAGADAGSYFIQLQKDMLEAKKYAERRGAAYGLAGMVKGRGIAALRQFRIMSALKAATEDKKNPDRRQGAMMGYELLSTVLGRTFEPYVVDVLPQLLVCFGDTSAAVRDACLDTAKTCFASLSSYGVHKVLPELLDGLNETQWRSKKGACDLLGAMAYLDPQQLAASLPDIIPPLTGVLTDSHKEVRSAANSSLKRFGEVISNPEVKSLVDILLKALSDPTKYTDDALDGLIKVSFIHYIDAPSLALIVRILERGLNDRSSTKRKAAQIIGSLAHLTEKRDIVTHLPILVSGLRAAAIDPVPATRATASKGLGSLVEKLGEDAFPDLIPSLMASLRTDTGASDRLGSAQALSEVLAGLGTTRLEETLPTILQNVASTRAVVREGFMTLFIFLPACFGNSFANYLAQIIPSVLSGLADDVEAIRDTALRAGRLLVKYFATKSIDLLLPELQRGLADDSYRIRLSSVELVGDLLFNLTGISAKTEADEDDDQVMQAGQSLLEVLGEERRNRVLSSLYICRCDTSGTVRAAAIAVWKALVATPRTLREIVPTLTQMLIVRLGSTNAEQKHIAANALGEVIRKSGEGIFTSLLPTLEDGLQTSTDADHRQGICIALGEVIAAASQDSIEENEKMIIGILRIALVDSDENVREAAAEAFDSLQGVVGKRAVDQVLPHLLHLLGSDEAQNALSALLTLLTEQMRANTILPNLIPTLIASPISAFNAKALASLAKVGGSAMNRRIPTILNSLADNIIGCKDEDRKTDLDDAFDAVLCSVDEFDGLNTAMSVMLQMVKHDDHNRRAIAATHLAAFFNGTDVDYSRYNQDLIRVLLISFDDRDKVVVSAAWTALSALQSHLRKEEMEALTQSTTNIMKQVGTPGNNLPGFALPKGIQPVLAVFLQGLMNGKVDERLAAANGISDIIDKSGPDSLKPFVTQITGPLIRVVGERSIEVKTAIIHALNQLLDKIPTFLRPFLPQLQRTFTKCIAEPTSDTLRNRAIKALSTLITLTPRIDPLITELTTGAKTTDTGVRNAMLKALQEVVSKVGANMSEGSRDAIFSLMDSPNSDAPEMMVVMAKLLGAMVKVLPPATASSLLKARVLSQPATSASILALNAVLAENAQILTSQFLEDTRMVLADNLASGTTFVQHNSVLAIGKLLLVSQETGDDSLMKETEENRPILETMAGKIKQGNDIDTRRLALVVARTLARHHNELMRPYITSFLLPVYQSLRDPVIPIKLAAEACFIQLFDVVDSESEVFDEFINSTHAKEALPPPMIRAISEYMRRVGMKLGTQKREQREAEGGVKGALGLSSDEVEDENEVWSVGRVEVSGTFDNDG